MTVRGAGRRRVLAVVLAAVTAAVGLQAAPAMAASGEATLVVAPDDGGIIRKGRDLTVEIDVTNSGTDALPAGTIALSLDDAPFASSTAMLAKLAEPTNALLGYLTTSTAKVPALPIDGTARVRATITKSDTTLRRLIGAGNGARLLYAGYQAGATRSVKKSVVAYVSTGFTGSIGFGTVVAVTAPQGATGLVTTDEQAALTQPGGQWDAALRAARRSPGATIALDPAVLASIRLAGTAAPDSAVDFLNGLQALPNEVVRLPYADGDVTLQRATGATSGWTPSSFSGSSVLSATTSDATPAPQPTASTGAAVPTTVAGLTEWDWSDQQVAWPVPKTARAGDLAALGRAGDAVLLSSSDLKDPPARLAAGPLAEVGRTRVLVSDATLSGLLATATQRSIQGDAALAEAAGILASAAVSRETTALLAVAGRGADANGLARVLGLLGRQRWIDGRSLSDLAEQRDPVAVHLGDNGITAARIGTAKALVAGEAEVGALGEAVTQGVGGVTGPSRLALLGLLSAQWRGNDRGWATAAATARKGFDALAGSVSIVFFDDQPGSSTNAIGSDGRLQVTVVNRLPAPVKVDVRAAVSNDRLQFAGDSAVTIAVPANASNLGRLAFRSITNGSTDVTLTLVTPKGSTIGKPVVRPVTVRAGFDTIVAIILLSALGLLLALGVYRNVRRRRRPRVVAA